MRLRRVAAIASCAAGVLLAAPAAGAACGGDPINPDRVIEGTFGTELRGSYVMVPFDVPKGTTAVRVKYCYDQPETRLPLASHTIDLGLYEPRRQGDAIWGEREFRGWGGSSHPDVVVSPEGFKPEASYREHPKSNDPGRTTRGFLPGPIPAGQWAAELGVASVIGRDQGDEDGRVGWRLEIELGRDPAFADEPYSPALYDDRPARAEPGWYAGDMHVHAEHSALGDATMRRVFDYAFGTAGLDFITLSDYVSGGAWGEIGRYQHDYPGRLITRSAEVITYRGHLMNHAGGERVDYRTGPVMEWHADGAVSTLRPARAASGVFARIRRAGGFTQINHPTIFPSAVPLFRSFCRGCPWDYDSSETRFDLVDGIEVTTGPPGLQDPVEAGPNPFTPPAIDFYEKALGAGNRIAAIGVSDSHRAGDPGDALQAPVGTGTTVVHAEELSECGIAHGVEAGHTYAKVFGPDGPDLRMEANAAGSTAKAIFGDAVSAPGSVHFEGRVLGAARTASRGPLLTLLVLRDGGPFRIFTGTGDGMSFFFDATEPGRYRLQLMRGTSIEAVSTPIWVERGDRGVVGEDLRPCHPALRLAVSARRVVRRALRGVPVACRAEGGAIARCRVRLRARTGGRIATIGAATAGAVNAVPDTASRRRVRVRLNRTGRALLRRHRHVRGAAEARATDGRDVERVARRRIVLAR